MAKSSTNQGIPVIGPILNRIIGTRNERFVKKYTMRVNAINGLEPEVVRLTDQQIREKLAEFRDRIDKGTPSGDLLVESFAVAREAMDRAVGIRNVFNPSNSFDPSQLPAPARELYAQTKAQMDAAPILLPRTLAAAPPTPPAGTPAPVPDLDDRFLGGTEPIPGWQQLDVPVDLYEAVKALFPESRPPFRARPFDVQLIGGMVLYQGKIAEMKTGEGKTIVAPLACYLAAIEHMKVHVVTVNDYLVQRDRDWTFPFFRALGLTVGAIHPMHMQPEQVKREMYRCDVVYGTTAEFGFDYLRDNMKRSVDQQVQKFRQFAVVDEVDSILIDEARTPLIISGAAHDDAPRYDMADGLARHLVERQKPWQAADDNVQECMRLIKGLEGDIRNAREKERIPPLEAQLKEAKARLPQLEADRARETQFYEVELDRKQAHLNHQGVSEAQRAAGIGSFYVGENMDLPHLLEQALRAHVVYQLDRDYIVAPTENPHTGKVEPSIVIVDTFTGRPMIGRQWSDGLHQACEAKEAVPVRQETQTVATVTIQNFFKMYKRLAGMTGTADTEAQEFHDIYHLDVVSIPTNKQVVRRDYDDLMFLVGKDKWSQIVDEIKTFHDVGRPVLVGTTSVEKSETLAKMLAGRHGIRHEVLNAKQHEREAHIIENAGQLGAVMIATNMAGRGTDIKLGRCTPEALLDHWLKRGLCSRTLTVAAGDDEVRENVFRKIGPAELEIPKREAEEMPFADLELRLLRHWAMNHTWLSPKRIETMNPEELRKALDDGGRFLLHRVRWFQTIEDMGGLHVIGTERHESRRIDNQLRGRSGRQGDKGSSRFYVSLDDDLMKQFAGQTTMKVLSTLGMKEGDAIEHPMLSRSVERAQRKVEERNFQWRKNILEYDEIMEHQRRKFYGLRQRVLEGRDVRGLIFDYITESVHDAVGLYLGRGYAADCAAEYARQIIDYPIIADGLRGRSVDDMIKRIRVDAKQEARAMIAVTIGEYMPETEGDAGVDFDAPGLAAWAKSHFDVEIDPASLRQTGLASRQEVQARLAEAAEKRIDEADLSGVARFTDKAYGAAELARWTENKFGIKISAEELVQLETSADKEAAISARILKETEELYRKREVEYPVEFAMAMAMERMRQSPQLAMEQMVAWANLKFGLGWTLDTLRTTPPQKARQELMDASAKFVAEGRLMKEIDAALACPDGPSLAAHFRQRFNLSLPDATLRLTGQEREDAIRSRVESILRAELLYFERTMLLETLDPAWKDHLYAMDQLRDTINYRAFSQQDPRIEYKREGSKLFNSMMESVRERVSDFVFKLRISPQAGPPQPPPPTSGGDGMYPAPSSPLRASPLPAVVRPASATPTGSLISGPGIDASVVSAAAAGAPPTAAPASERQHRDLEAAQRAGSPIGARSVPIVRTEKRYGRNDPCPRGCGRKYKKCCNRSDGACDGSGMSGAAPGDNGED